MTLAYEYSKMKLPKKGFSYPVKKTELDKALENAGVTDIRRIGFAFSSKKALDGREYVLEAYTQGESRQGYWSKESPHLIVGAVPSSLKKEISELIAKKGLLPSLAKWLKELEKGGSVRRDKDQFFKVYYDDGNLSIEHT